MKKILIIAFFISFTFLRIHAQWSQVWNDIDGINGQDNTGYSVSLSGDGLKVAIGEIGASGNGHNNCGRVRVFLNNSSTSSWNQQGQDIFGTANYDNSGKSVSLSADGTTLAIASSDNAGGGFFRGQVRVFQWNAGSNLWIQKGPEINGTVNAIQFGYSVSLSANGLILAVGAPSHPGGGLTRGEVKVYQWNGSSWAQLGNNMDGEADLDFSGWSVSLSADGLTVAIGAPQNDAGSSLSTNPGHVRVYHFNGLIWLQSGDDIDGQTVGYNGDFSGNSVSLSGDGKTVAIGAIGYQSGRGLVRVYDLNSSGQWMQKGLDIPGATIGDYFGSSVSISANDGLTVAIGAFQYSNYRGQVQVYSFITDASGSSWKLQGLGIDGEADGDYSGYSVSLAGNGKTVAIGAFLNNPIPTDSTYRGHVRVYEHISSFRQMQSMIDDLTNISEALRNTLLNKLMDGLRKYCNGNTKTATNKINALINQLEGIKGKKRDQIPVSKANELIAQAEIIIAEMDNGSLNCSSLNLNFTPPPIITKRSTISLFPNPAVEEALLDLSSYADKDCIVQLIDIRGVHLQEWNVNKYDRRLLKMNLRSIPSGLYIVQVYIQGQGIESLKLLKD